MSEKNGKKNAEARRSAALIAAASFAVCCFASIFARSTGAQEVALRFREAQTPVLISADGSELATALQTFDLTPSANGGASLERLTATVFEPRLWKRWEIRIGERSFAGESEQSFAAAVDFAEFSNEKEARKITFEFDSATTADVETFELWAFPSDAAGPDSKTSVVFESATVGGREVAFDAGAFEYRFGVLVRDSGWNGVAKYRIPGLIVSRAGTLIAVYDVRRRGAADLPADVDVGCSRSFDGGKTWEPMRIVLDFQGADATKEGVGDPAILVDPKTGRIWVAALWAHNGRSIATSEPGLELGKSGQLVLAFSDDDGATWSEPVSISKEAAGERDWRILFQGPGAGIATRDGQLVFPAQAIDRDGGWFSTIIWSGDGGASWKCANPAIRGTCEAQVVELNDGSLMLNARNFSGRARSVATTRDLGETWREHTTSKKALPEPICQASLIRVASTLDGDAANILAFANPKSTTARVDTTLQLSFDEGETWTRSATIYRPKSWGYSSLAKIDAETIGALYETQGGLIYQTIFVRDVPENESKPSGAH